MDNQYAHLFTNNYGAYAVKSEGATLMHNIFNDEEFILTRKSAKGIDAELLLNASGIESVGAAVICSPCDAIIATSVGAEGITSYPYKSNAKNIAAIKAVLISDKACGIIGVGVLATGESLDEAMDNAVSFNEKCREYISGKIGSATPHDLADKIKSAYINKKQSERDGADNSAEGDSNE